MPYETRLFIKTGMACLVLTFAIGAVLLILAAVGRPAPYVFQVEHAHLGFVGWLVNVVMGVALWMFPLDQGRYPRTRGRYSTPLVIWIYLLLNSGLLVRLLIEPTAAFGKLHGAGAALLIAAALAQFLAIALFVATIWSRVRSPSQAAPGLR